MRSTVRFLFNLLFFGAVSTLVASVTFAAELADESVLETAFIYQFTNFIEWPETANSNMANGTDPFVITVIGSSAIVKDLSELAKSKTVHGAAIVVKASGDETDFVHSKIIFVASPDATVLQNALKKTNGSSALIIGRTEGFAQKGAMINFYSENGKLRFEINRKALENRKLRAGSQLLHLAKVLD